MNEYTEKAVSRLTAEYKTFKGDRYEEVMKGDVRDALIGFCKQNGEFAQAVAQGGDFKGCMKAVASGCGCSISDMRAYARAVGYYFRGATVRGQFQIQLEPDAETAPQEDRKQEPPKDERRGILLDLADFL